MSSPAPLPGDTPAAPAFSELAAPRGWRSVDFISDLHLQADEGATFEAWRKFLGATPSDAVFILGDLFEAWVGDDAAAEPGFARECAAAMKSAAAARPLFFMHGNRDFLVGAGWMHSLGVTLLDDPTVLAFAGQRWLLTHGDALCLDDSDYMRFRAQVRAPDWQTGFLARPLAARQAIARSMRQESEARKRSGATYGDLDARAVDAWLDAAHATTMIHGHTHQPADHALTGGRKRIVLSDWDAAANPPRMEVLRVSASGAHRIALA